ncbi:MAG: ribonuclease P protein component [Acidimicrobiales bacterium]
MPAVGSARGRAVFGALRRSRRFRGGPVTLTWVPSPAGSPVRVAYAVGRRVGGAVVRNRLRRRLRAVAAEINLAPGVYLIGADVEAVECSFSELRTRVTEVAMAARALPAPPAVGADVTTPA